MEDEEETQKEPTTLLLHALHGMDLAAENQTMKLVGHFKKRRLNVLVDSDSTHTFLDLAVAKQIGHTCQRIRTQKVLVANGSRMDCEAMIRGFKWSMQGKESMTNVLLMLLSGCELILGMEWLNAIGVIKWDFPSGFMTVTLKAYTESLETWK